MGQNALLSIFVLGAGTGGSEDDDCNADGYSSSIYTMAISSVEKQNKKQVLARGARPSLPRLTAETKELELGWQLQASQLTVPHSMMGQLQVPP